jgi:glutathione S-transferase
VLCLYDYLTSGNGYKVRLLLTQLAIPFRRIELDLPRGDARSEGFQRINPNRRIPVLEWPDGRRLAESNAIIWHLAEGTPYLPADAWQRAETLQWLFFEQYDHEPSIAVARSWHLKNLLEKYGDQLPQKHERGYLALGVMEQHLAEAPFMVGRSYGIADIALYAYTHVAHEGGFSLARYPRVRAWLDRVKAQPGHIPITEPGETTRWPT